MVQNMFKFYPKRMEQIIQTSELRSPAQFETGQREGRRNLNPYHSARDDDEIRLWMENRSSRTLRRLSASSGGGGRPESAAAVKP
jgi:hypothetical protein